MEIHKKTKEYTIFKKKSGRHAVVNPNGDYVKAADKVKILLGEKLIELTPQKKKEEAPTAPEGSTPPATETPAS